MSLRFALGYALLPFQGVFRGWLVAQPRVSPRFALGYALLPFQGVFRGMACRTVNERSARPEGATAHSPGQRPVVGSVTNHINAL